MRNVNVLLTLPGRWMAPILLGLFALVASGLNYAWRYTTAGDLVVAQETQRLREHLSIQQTHLQELAGPGNALRARRLVSGLALHAGLDHAYLVDGNGLVQASLLRQDLGRPFGQVAREGVARWAPQTDKAASPRSVAVRVDGSGAALLGSLPLAAGQMLNVRVDISHPLALHRAEALRDALRLSALMMVGAGLLAVLLHLTWFRRAKRLVATLSDMGSGRLDVRSDLEGRDELAQIAAEANQMARRLRIEHAQQQKMSDLVNRSPVVVIEWEKDVGWPVSYVSDAVRQWGYKVGDFRQGRILFTDLIHPEDLERVNAEVDRYFQHGPDSYRQEYRIRCADGRWAWLDDRTTLERNARGEVSTICGVLLDITVQREAQNASQEQTDLARLFFELPFIGMAITSPETKRWLQVNDRLCEILGRTRDELLASAWSDITPPGDLERNLVLFNELVTGQSNGYRLQKRFVRKDGSFVFTELDVKAIRHQNGSVRHLLTTIEDITERTQAAQSLIDQKHSLERRVEERTKELSVANQELEAFSYSVSHDLKAPLRGIEGFSALLEEDFATQLGPDGLGFVGKIRQGARKMSALINDLLEYSRMERQTMQPRTVDLRALVQELLDMQRTDLEQHGTEVELRLDGMMPQLDREGLSVILRNLIGNAIKFSAQSQPPRVEIGALLTGDQVRIWVRDNGVGFDMKYHDRMFAIFQRLHQPSQYPGTGVGLAMVAKAVQRMAGRVWAESEPGQGTVFWLEFPV